MIVRETPNSFVLIKQHDHAQISGEFARRWAAGFNLREPTLYAIREHDTGWRKLDQEVRFNPETGHPYSFTNYPLEPKLRAYAEGIGAVEAKSSYAACLCSMHYASLVRREKGKKVADEFRERELARQERLRAGFSEEEFANLEYNFRLLQLCDDFSLFVCLNQPGRNDHPWYRDGFRFMGEKLEPVWEGRRVLSARPNPFSESFDLALPYEEITKDGRPLGSDWIELRVAC